MRQSAWRYMTHAKKSPRSQEIIKGFLVLLRVYVASRLVALQSRKGNMNESANPCTAKMPKVFQIANWSGD
jgi:hypothetical protein